MSSHTRHYAGDPNHRNAPFSLLVGLQPRWSTVGAGFALQCASLASLILWPMFIPQKLVPVMHYQVVQLAMPRTEVPLPSEPPRTKPKILPKLIEEVPVQPPKVAKMVAPPKPIVPKAKPKEVPQVNAPKFDPMFAAAKLEGPKEPPRPRAPVETGTLGTGSAAAPTLPSKVRPDEVQTGGFGDPNGLPGKGDPNKRANIAQKGQFDLPSGPGYGNGTGGVSGMRGTVASAGFGNGVATALSGGGGKRGVVQSRGFSDATVPTEAPKKVAPPSSSPTRPVEILAKPKPVYTEEARNLKLEGEVLLDVVFPASGSVRVLRVLQGLGHGLDEAAQNAARQIRFEPALRDDQPVDFPAVIHIVFQLAY